MFSKELENLIQATLVDGILTDEEKMALVKRAEKEGVDLAELDIYINSLLQKKMQTERINNEEKDLAYEKERRGNICHHCGTPIPPLTKTCPNCGAVVGSNETVGDKDLTKLADNMETALINLKAADSTTLIRDQAEVESLLRKAKTFYGDNKKVQILVFDLEEEMKKTLISHKKAKNKELVKSIGKRVVFALLWLGLAMIGFWFCILFFFSGYRNALGDLWRKMIGSDN